MPGPEKDHAGPSSERRKRKSKLDRVNPVRKFGRASTLRWIFYGAYPQSMARLISNGVKEEICPRGRQ
jgi:hypothetical protein